MRLALYSLLFLGTVLLSLDLAKLVKDIDPPKTPETPASAAPMQETSPPSETPHGQPSGHPDIEQALAIYTEEIEKNPDQAKGYVKRANAHIANKNYPKAIEDYNQAIRLEAEVADHYLQRGTLHLSSSRQDLALADFNRALELSPRLSKALAYRAFIHFRSGNHQGALADCLGMLENDPSFTDLHTTIAQCYHALGNQPKAIEHIKLYLETTSDPEGKKEAETLLKQWTAPAPANKLPNTP